MSRSYLAAPANPAVQPGWPAMLRCWTFGDRSGVVRDLTGRDPLTPSAGVSRTFGPHGPALDFAASSHADGLIEEVLTTGRPFSIAVCAELLSFAATSYPGLVVLSATGTSFGLSLSNGGSYAGVLIGAEAGWARGASGTSAAELVGVTHLYGCDYNGGTATDLASFSARMDGLRLALSNPGAFGSRGNETILGAETSGGQNGFTGRMDVAYVFDGVLSDSQWYALAADPFAPIRPPEDFSAVLAAALIVPEPPEIPSTAVRSSTLRTWRR